MHVSAVSEKANPAARTHRYSNNICLDRKAHASHTCQSGSHSYNMLQSSLRQRTGQLPTGTANYNMLQSSLRQRTGQLPTGTANATHLSQQCARASRRQIAFPAVPEYRKCSSGAEMRGSACRRHWTHTMQPWQQLGRPWFRQPRHCSAKLPKSS